MPSSLREDGSEGLARRVRRARELRALVRVAAREGLLDTWGAQTRMAQTYGVSRQYVSKLVRLNGMSEREGRN